MKTTKEIAVILTDECLKKVNALKLGHGSPNWLHVLKRLINDTPSSENISLMECLEFYNDNKTRENAASSLIRALSLNKLSFMRETLNTEYFNYDKVTRKKRATAKPTTTKRATT